MIPKIIHFCWFGGNPLPPLALECIASWRKYLPDYEIWMWVESDDSKVSGERLEVSGIFADKVMAFDVNIIPYTAEAYRQMKYAFVSDYARFWVMYKYGGIYFDTDVEVIRPMDDIIANGNFMGFEQDPDGENTPGKYAPRYAFAVNPGVGFGIEKEHPFIKNMLGLYNRMETFVLPTSPYGKTIVAYTTEMLCKEGLENAKRIQQVGDITIYPSEYFAPINPISRRLHITNNTRTIHRYMASWLDKDAKDMGGMAWIKEYAKRCIPECVYMLNNRIKRKKYKIK